MVEPRTPNHQRRGRHLLHCASRSITCVYRTERGGQKHHHQDAHRHSASQQRSGTRAGFHTMARTQPTGLPHRRGFRAAFTSVVSPATPRMRVVNNATVRLERCGINALRVRITTERFFSRSHQYTSPRFTRRPRRVFWASNVRRGFGVDARNFGRVHARGVRSRGV